ASRRRPHMLLASSAEVLCRDAQAAGVADAMIEAHFAGKSQVMDVPCLYTRVILGSYEEQEHQTDKGGRMQSRPFHRPSIFCILPPHLLHEIALRGTPA